MKKNNHSKSSATPKKVPYKYHDVKGHTFREYRVYDEQTGEATGRAIVLFDGFQMALLYDIRIENKDRRKGYGSALIAAIQNDFLAVITSWYSEAGRQLCLKCGFDVQNGGSVQKLVWSKEAESL